MTTLTDTQLLVLSAAASRADRLVTKHKRLPGASLQRVCAALVKRGLLAELTGVSPDATVLQVKTELGLTEYAITRSGLAAIGVEEDRRISARPRSAWSSVRCAIAWWRSRSGCVRHATSRPAGRSSHRLPTRC